MLQNSTNTLSSLVMLASTFTVATVSSAGYAMRSVPCDNWMSIQAYEVKYGGSMSGEAIMSYGYSGEKFVRSHNISSPLGISLGKRQIRYQKIEKSFLKHSNEFPIESKEHFTLLANAMCELPFDDNVVYYNEYDQSIDSVFKLSNGLTLSVAQFLDEEVDAPAVFSVHRNKTLLISDEMPVRELVSIVGTISTKLADGSKQ